MHVSKIRDVKIYINVSGAGDSVPDGAAALVRAAIDKIGGAEVSPLWAIQPLVAECRGEIDISLEWHFGPERSIGALIRVDGDRVCRVIEGGIGYDGPSGDETYDPACGPMVGVGALGIYSIEYGPRSILRWLANVVEPGTPPTPKVAPDSEPDGGSDRRDIEGPPSGAGGWYAARLRRAMGDE